MNTLVTLITAGITFGTVLLYGTLGEILTEKSGNLNLGVEGIMYMGGAFGLAGAFYYEKAAGGIGNGPVAIVIAILAAFAAGALASAIYSFLTITPSQLSRAMNAIYDSYPKNISPDDLDGAMVHVIQACDSERRRMIISEYYDYEEFFRAYPYGWSDQLIRKTWDTALEEEIIIDCDTEQKSDRE